MHCISASGHGGVPPCPAITRLSRGVRGVCSVRPLRPPASLLHITASSSVPASRCAKAPLGAGHRLRALSGEDYGHYAKWPSLEAVEQPSALPARIRALRAAVCAPLWVCLHLGISQALRAVLCAPARPWASPLRGLAPR